MNVEEYWGKGWSLRPEQKIQEEFRKMKATGIVRRIDDLGRVVIPKEIRKTLRIKEGTPLEIFTDREGQIILKKYSPIGELNTFAAEISWLLITFCNPSGNFSPDPVIVPLFLPVPGEVSPHQYTPDHRPPELRWRYGLL